MKWMMILTLTHFLILLSLSLNARYYKLFTKSISICECWNCSTESAVFSVINKKTLHRQTKNFVYSVVTEVISCLHVCSQKFPDWPPGARTASGTALCR